MYMVFNFACADVCLLSISTTAAMVSLPANNLGLQMVRVLCWVIIKVIGATTRTRVASLVQW